MPLAMILVEGYRSVRKVWTRLDHLNLVLGPNGSGKTNLHRALGLLVSAASGTLARAVVEEGGMPSLGWAGDRRNNDPIRVTVEARFHDFTYALEIGLLTHPVKTVSAYALTSEYSLRSHSRTASSLPPYSPDPEREHRV